jgi:hypothetical protein
MDTNINKDIERFNRFWKKVGTCHSWQNALDKDGYGTFYFIKKNRRAHRVAYFIKYGDIKEGMVIDHICRNRSCVNPEHLRQVTRLENSMTNSLSVGAVNKSKTTCSKGHIFDRKYGKQRYCSICQAAKTKRLRKQWKEKADSILC